MRYGIRPEGLLEHVAMRIGAVPVPVLDMLIPLVKVRAIMAAVRLGVFRAVADGRSTAPAIAAQCELDTSAVELLLRVLVGAGYVEQRGEAFALTALGAESFVGPDDGPYGAYVLFNYTQWELMDQLEPLLRTGKGSGIHHTWAAEDASWRFYQGAMLSLAEPVGRLLARKVPVPAGARRLLDLGGGHGALGAAVCRAHPPLRSIVCELPAALPHARRLAEREGLTDVVAFRACNLVRDPWPEDADVVLAANVLHHFASSKVDVVLRRAHDALRPKGTLAIWELEMPDATAPAELATDSVALYFRLSSTSAAYRVDDLERAVKNAGFQRLRVVRSVRTPGRVLLLAERP